MFLMFSTFPCHRIVKHARPAPKRGQPAQGQVAVSWARPTFGELDEPPEALTFSPCPFPTALPRLVPSRNEHNEFREAMNRRNEPLNLSSYESKDSVSYRACFVSTASLALSLEMTRVV